MTVASTMISTLLLVLSMSLVQAVRFNNTCIDDAPTVPAEKTGCGVLPFMDQRVFGDNAKSAGVLIATPRRRGLDVVIKLNNLSKPNLVLTAWLVYALPNDPNSPNVFRYGYIASPLAPTNAAYTSGLGREPNQFKYTSRTTARLSARLNFNPTYANEGPLAFSGGCRQRDIPGIQTSSLAQPRIATVGAPYPNDVFVPAGSMFLREYDAKTGFEKLDRRGRPVLVRSPLKAFAVAIAGHIDKATHGISPGVFAGDHFEVMSFVLDQTVGRATQ